MAAPTTFITSSQVGSTPSTNTTAFKQKKTLEEIQKVSNQLFEAKAAAVRQLFNWVWANQYGLSPALAIQSLGTNAVLAQTQFDTEVASLIAQQPAGWVYPDTRKGIADSLVVPAGFTLTPNADGSMTIVEPV